MNFEKNCLSLCVDIDGTVTGAYDWLPYTNNYFGQELTEDQINHYDIHTVYGLPREAYLEFYGIHGKTVHSNNTPRPYADQVLAKLRNRGHEVHFVTARDMAMKEITEKWLHDHHMTHDSLNLLGSHHKVQKAFDLNCDVFIEDRYENAIDLAKAGFLVILVNCNYNQGHLPPSVTRLENWQEIEAYLERYLSFYFHEKIAN